MQDAYISAALVLSFATTLTAHIALLVGCTQTLREKPATFPAAADTPDRGWQILALWFIPPLVPWWGFRFGMMMRVIVWLLGVLVYAGTRVLCAR